MAKRRAEYAPEGERILVHLSNFRPVKRVTDTIEIFERVRKRGSGQAAVSSAMAPTAPGPSGWRCRNAFMTTSCFSASRTKCHEKLALADILLHAERTRIFWTSCPGGDGLCQFVPDCHRG